MITFAQALESGYRRLFDFEGRSSRAEYWWFFLFVWVLMLFGGYLVSDDGAGVVVAIAMGLFGLVTWIAMLAVFVRRLHDTDHSGWWMVPVFIPLIGVLFFFALIVFLARRGDAGNNKYGMNPIEPDIKIEVID